MARSSRSERALLLAACPADDNGQRVAARRQAYDLLVDGGESGSGVNPCH